MMPYQRRAALETRTPFADGAPRKARAPGPCLRRAELRGVGSRRRHSALQLRNMRRRARGLDVEEGAAVSLRRPGILDDVLGEKLVSEPGVEAGQRCALDESGTRESREIDVFSPRQCCRRALGRCRSAVCLSVAGEEGAWLAYVRASGRVMRRTVTDIRGGGNRAIRRVRASPTVVPKTGLLVTLFLVCCSRRCGYFAGLGPGVSHASDRGGGDCFTDLSGCSIVRCLSSRRYRIMRACQRRYASPSSPS